MPFFFLSGKYFTYWTYIFCSKIELYEPFITKKKFLKIEIQFEVVTYVSIKYTLYYKLTLHSLTNEKITDRNKIIFCKVYQD